MMATQRSLRGILARLAIPTFAAIVGDQLLGIADTIVIGTLGPPALAAITAATTVFVVLVLLLHGITQGAGILGAQAIGAGDYERFGRITRAAVVVPAILAIALGVGSIWLAEPALRALVGPLPTISAGSMYLILRCFALIPAVLSGLAYTVFGAAGDTRFGFRLLVFINVIHIPLLLVLALGYGTHRPLGLIGAGISSLVAESLACLYALFSVWQRPQYMIFERPQIDLRLALRIARLSLPEAIYLFLVVAPDVAIIAVLAPLGAATVAAFRIIAIMSEITWAVPGSLGSAAQTVIGQRLGAGDIAGAQRFESYALRCGIGLSTVCGVVVALLAWPIGFACTLDATLATFAAAPLALHMLTLPLKGYTILGIARVRASGDTRFAMYVGIITSAIVVPGTWLGVHALHVGLYSVPLAWIAAWLVWCAAATLRRRRFNWDAKLAM